MPTAKKNTTKRVSKKEALTSCGTKLKPGYKYVKGGGVVKVVAKKSTAKKGKLGSSAPCVRTNPDGSRTTYTSHGGTRPCPHGGKQVISGSMLNGRKSTKRRTTKR